MYIFLEEYLLSGADPGFPVGGGASPAGGCHYMILPPVFEFTATA